MCGREPLCRETTAPLGLNCGGTRSARPDKRATPRSVGRTAQRQARTPSRPDTKTPADDAAGVQANQNLISYFSGSEAAPNLYLMPAVISNWYISISMR